MYKIEPNFIHKLFNDFSRAMVGKLCKQNEIIEKDESLSKLQSLKLLKDFNKELIYEAVRDLENQIKAYQSGQTITKFSIYTPSDKKCQ